MKFNTDKFTHGYIEIYEKYFQKCDNVENLLEIGIFNGDSLKYFNNYFPNSNIYGIDIIDKSIYNTDKIKTFICRQENRTTFKKILDELNTQFDIIIDDGGHTMRQQQTSLGFLFPYVKKGGLYIIEDLHTSNHEFNKRCKNAFIGPTDNITTLDMLNNFKNTRTITSNHITNEEKSILENEMENIEIWSKTPDFEKSVTSIIQKK